MARYAERTKVSVEKSQGEVKQVLQRYGAARIGIMEDDRNKQHSVVFECNDREVRITIPVPAFDDSNDKAKQERRRIWRALVLSIKAKLEAIHSDISTFETEFLPFIVTANGKTVGENVLPRLNEAVRSGKLLPHIT